MSTVDSSSTDEEWEDAVTADSGPVSPEGYKDGADTYDRPHSVDDPAHLRPNTMEHLTLGLMAEFLLDREDSDSAFEVTEMMVDPREFIEWDRSAVEITESQGTNALFRLWKKGLVERDRGSGRKSHAFGYELNRAGAAEIERLGEIDPDEFDLPFDDTDE